MTAGWYGKLPALGDFAQRRLEQDFIVGWDTWLQSVIVDSQRILGGNWLSAYLRAPVWRFVLAPGVVDSRNWSGILLPSVDRVGRYFPPWQRPAPSTWGHLHLAAQPWPRCGVAVGPARSPAAPARHRPSIGSPVTH